MRARIKRVHTHIEASAHESAQNVSSCTKMGGEVSVLLCIGVSHFFTMIYERVHECLTMNKHNKAYTDSLGEVCSALKPRPLVKRKTVSNTQKGVFQVKIIYCELNKTIKHTGEIANTGLLNI